MRFVEWRKQTVVLLTNSIRNLPYLRAFGGLWIDLVQTLYNDRSYLAIRSDISLSDLGMIINITKLYSLMPMWMTLAFIQVHMLLKKQGLVHSFSCKMAWSNSNVCDGWLCFHIIYGFIGLRRDTYEPVCFKLGMMPDATKLYTTIPVLMASVFHHGHRFTGKARTCSMFNPAVVRWHEVF